MKFKFISPASLRLLLSCSVIAVASAAMAAPVVSGNPVSMIHSDSAGPDQPLVSFIGSDNEYFFFRVQIGNPSGKKYEIILRDKSVGTILYSDSFSNTEFVRRIAVPRDITLLQWDLRNVSGKGSVYKNTFSLSTEVKLKEDVLVTRL